MKNLKPILFSALLVLVVTVARAREPAPAEVKPLYFSGVVNYQAVSRIEPKVVAECKIQESILTGIKEKTDKNKLPLTQTPGDRELTVEIVEATPGFFMIGPVGGIPATLEIKFKVVEGDRVLLEENKNCQTKRGGFLGLDSSACNKLEKCGLSSGVYVSERTRRMLYY